jgi:hypothetical protein
MWQEYEGAYILWTGEVERAQWTEEPYYVWVRQCPGEDVHIDVVVRDDQRDVLSQLMYGHGICGRRRGNSKRRPWGQAFTRGQSVPYTCTRGHSG